MTEDNGTPTLAYVLISVEVGRDNAKNVADQVAALTGVMWAASVTGPFDVIAQVLADDNADLGNIVAGDIQAIADVVETVTAVATYQVGGMQGYSAGP
jgi:DNA-binding Lrp family transcriptional regulator